MDSFFFAIAVPVFAVLLDTLLGDPHNFPHPVRYIGNGLDLFEGFARKVGMNLRFAGWFALVIFSGTMWAIAEFFMSIPGLGFVVAVYLGYAGLALGCLIKECRKVAALVDQGKIVEARKALAMLVSRDTSQLDEKELRRSLAETVSENLNDGFVAPMFYLVLLGPGGMWAYKVVSTMDSMWGYKTDKYRELGYAGAKTDDVLAFIPARLTAWLLLWVGKWHGLNYSQAKARFQDDAWKMESPNAGWPMAAAAWLVGGQMGGGTVYFGKVKDKPVLGPAGVIWTGEMLQQLLSLCRSTGYWSAGVCIIGASILRWAIH